MICCNSISFIFLFDKGQRLTTDETVSYIRNLLATWIRSNPHQRNCLVTGLDIDGPKLYWLYYLWSYVRLLKAAHGYGAYFLYGLMDNFYKKNLSLAEAEIIVKNCIKEFKTRYLENSRNFLSYFYFSNIL